VFVNVPGNQVPHASLWTGTAVSWVDLNPSLPTINHAVAHGIAPGQVVGWVVYEGAAYEHASTWAGSASSWQDIHPNAATRSSLYATTGEFQTGAAEIGGARHASVWAGTAASWNRPPCGAADGGLLAFGRSGHSPIGIDALCRWLRALHRQDRDHAILWSAPVPGVCYPNCDNSTVAPILNVADFICFLNKYAAGDPYANCDGSTAAPTLNVADFICFMNAYAAGCS
jgi:hypothetical protein